MDSKPIERRSYIDPYFQKTHKGPSELWIHIASFVNVFICEILNSRGSIDKNS